MTNTAIASIACVCAGVLGGSFSTPLTLGRSTWSWEATWLVYSVLAYAAFPWLAAAVTCPDLSAALTSVSSGVLAETAVFGLLWGVGSQLFGVGIALLGNSLGFALILGLVATVGSIVPLLVLHTHEAASAQGAWNFAGLILVIVGLRLVMQAATLKAEDDAASQKPLLGDSGGAGRGESESDAAPAKTELNGTGDPTQRAKGYAVCLLSGVFSAALNFAASFGSDIADAAAANGATAAMKDNAVWAVAMSAGAVPNIAFCCYLLCRNGTWGDLSPFGTGRAESRGPSRYLRSLVIAVAMAVLWFGGFVVYGAGTSFFPGSLGTVVGWPINMTTQIMVANVSGVVGGEWRHARPRARTFMKGGLAVLVVAIVFIGIAGL